jgi:hypothetical protein
MALARMMHRLALLVALASFLTGGCSVLLMKPVPPDHERRMDFQCTSGGWTILGDGLGAYLTIGVAASLDNGDDDYAGSGPPPPRREGRNLMGTVVASGLVVAYLASAGYGAYKGKECREALQALAIRRSTRPFLAAGAQAPGGPDPWLRGEPPPGTPLDLGPPPPAPAPPADGSDPWLRGEPPPAASTPPPAPAPGASR